MGRVVTRVGILAADKVSNGHAASNHTSDGHDVNLKKMSDSLLNRGRRQRALNNCGNSGDGRTGNAVSEVSKHFH